MGAVLPCSYPEALTSALMITITRSPTTNCTKPTLSQFGVDHLLGPLPSKLVALHLALLQSQLCTITSSLSTPPLAKSKLAPSPHRFQTRARRLSANSPTCVSRQSVAMVRCPIQVDCDVTKHRVVCTTASMGPCNRGKRGPRIFPHQHGRFARSTNIVHISLIHIPRSLFSTHPHASPTPSW